MNYYKRKRWLKIWHLRLEASTFDYVECETERHSHHHYDIYIFHGFLSFTNKKVQKVILKDNTSILYPKKNADTCRFPAIRMVFICFWKENLRPINSGL